MKLLSMHGDLARVVMLLTWVLHSDSSPVKSGQEGKGLAMLTGAASLGAAASSSAVISSAKLKEQTAGQTMLSQEMVFLRHRFPQTSLNMTYQECADA